MSDAPKEPARVAFMRAATGIAAGTGIAAATYFGEGIDAMVSVFMGTATGIMVYGVYDPCAKSLGKMKNIPDFFKRHF